MDLVHLPGVEKSFVGKLRDKLAAEMPHVDPHSPNPARAAERAAAGHDPVALRDSIAQPAPVAEPTPPPRMAPNPAQGSSAHAAAPAPQHTRSPRESIRDKAAGLLDPTKGLNR